MTDPRTEAAREWVSKRADEYEYGENYGHGAAWHLALIDYIVDMEKRLEQWQDYIKTEIERKDDD